MKNKIVSQKKKLLIRLARLLCFNVFLLACLFSNGIGCFTPICSDCLEVTVIKIRLEEVLKTFTDDQIPPEGKSYIVVDTAIKVLKEVNEKDLDLGSIYLLNEKGEFLSDLKGYGGIGKDGIVTNIQICYDGCQLILKEGTDYYLGFVFIIDKVDVSQNYAISIPEFDPIQVSLEL